VELAEQLVELAEVLADIAADTADRMELEVRVEIQQLEALKVLLVAVYY
jgi:hypothetical protein